METDETVYRRYLDGDEGGMRELLERYGDPLTLYINGYVKNIPDAEDLMIEAFAYLTTKRPMIRDGGFKAYLFKTARSYSLRFLGQQRKHTVFSLDELEYEPESGELVETIVQTNQRSRIVHLCMADLQPDYREALFLVYFEGMSYREVAGVMEKSEKQIDKLLQSGKKHLRAALEKEGLAYADNG